MPQCDACKADFEDLFIVEDGTKLCARCLEMEAFEKIAAVESSQKSTNQGKT